jgi:opacity protein-like surface antigen
VKRRLALATLVCSFTLCAAAASAQDSGRGRIEVAGGVRWIGALDLGSVAADETAPGGDSNPLFRSATTLEGSAGAAGSVGVRLSPSFQLEFTAGYNRTSLRSEVSADIEAIPDTVVDAPVTQFLFEGGVVLRPGAWRGRRLSPFLAAGAGYLRQLNDGRTLVESGRSYSVGGGLYYQLETSGDRRLKATGLRFDVRALILQKGVAGDDTSRVATAAFAGAFVRF